MAGKYVAIDTNGNKVEEAAIASTSGVGDAGKIVKTDATGKIDSSLMPGSEQKTVVASEALSAGDFVNIWNDSGTAKARKADASAANAGKRADGFTLSAVSQDADAIVYTEGVNNQLTGLVPGTMYFLSGTAGACTSTPVTTSGSILQLIGPALSATEVAFEPGEPIIRA